MVFYSVIIYYSILFYYSLKNLLEIIQALDFRKRHSEKRKKLSKPYNNVLKMLCCISNSISCNCLKIHNRPGRTATILKIDDKNIYFSRWLISLLFISFPKVLLIAGRRPAKWCFFGTNTKFTNETFFQHCHKEYWILSITYWKNQLICEEVQTQNSSEPPHN